MKQILRGRIRVRELVHTDTSIPVMFTKDAFDCVELVPSVNFATQKYTPLSDTRALGTVNTDVNYVNDIGI